MLNLRKKRQLLRVLLLSAFRAWRVLCFDECTEARGSVDKGSAGESWDALWAAGSSSPAQMMDVMGSGRDAARCQLLFWF